jgi:hypothetical protein
VAVGIPEARGEVIFIPRDSAGALHLFRQFRVISAGEVEGLSVRSDDNLVRAVLAFAFHLPEKLRLAEAALSVDVLEAPKTGRALLVSHHVEAVKGVEKSVGTADLGVELLDVVFVPSTVMR